MRPAARSARAPSRQRRSGRTCCPAAYSHRFRTACSFRLPGAIPRCFDFGGLAPQPSVKRLTQTTVTWAPVGIRCPHGGRRQPPLRLRKHIDRFRCGLRFPRKLGGSVCRITRGLRAVRFIGRRHGGLGHRTRCDRNIGHFRMDDRSGFPVPFRFSAGNEGQDQRKGCDGTHKGHSSSDFHGIFLLYEIIQETPSLPAARTFPALAYAETVDRHLRPK